MKKNNGTLLVGILVFIIVFWNLFTYSAIFTPEDRLSLKEDIHKKQTIEGSFFDSRGESILNPTENYVNDTANLPVEYSYLLGYNSVVYGTTGLRSKYAKHLYNDNDTGKGGSIHLTTDNMLQKMAYSMLETENLSGAIIVMDAKNAEILAMAGRQKINYDINRLNIQKYGETDEDGVPEYAKTWKKYVSTDEFFLDPAIMDIRAPGSVYKVVTSAAALVNGMENYTYTDTGTLGVDGKEINNAGQAVYGEQTLQTALINSTNTYFGSLSTELGSRAMADIADSFLIGEDHVIDLGFSSVNSIIEFDGGEHNLAMLGFGQGALAISPLHVAMIGQSIVNDGVMIKPTIIKAMYDANGNVVFENNRHEVLARPLKPDVAADVKKLMKGVAEARDEGKKDEEQWLKKYTENIYMKTGTAQATDNAKVYNSSLLCMTDDYVILVSIKDTARSGGSFQNMMERFLKELY